MKYKSYLIIIFLTLSCATIKLKLKTDKETFNIQHTTIHWLDRRNSFNSKKKMQKYQKLRSLCAESELMEVYFSINVPVEATCFNEEVDQKKAENNLKYIEDETEGEVIWYTTLIFLIGIGILIF